MIRNDLFSDEIKYLGGQLKLKNTEILVLTIGIIFLLSYTSSQSFMANKIYKADNYRNEVKINKINENHNLTDTAIDLIKSNTFKSYLKINDTQIIQIKEISNLLPGSSVVEHLTGIKSELKFNEPSYLKNKQMAKIQCSRNSLNNNIIIFGQTLKFLLNEKTCDEYLNRKKINLNLIEENKIIDVQDLDHIQDFSLYLISNQ